MTDYDPKEIEKKWQEVWDKKHQYDAVTESRKPKFYGLMEFPYPSGDGLHTGHVRGYTAMDIISRKRRMEGFSVLFPIGWDAFGLPTENYALKTGRPPQEITKENTDNYREQFKSLGMSFDWSREINTTDPKYYKWTQWIFLKLLENNLAYKARIPINWCPKDKIGLANEEVIDGKCERCGTEVVEKEKEQWMLAITKYADRLEKDLETVDYPERVKAQQRNWIGRSEGALIQFDDYEVFTTRPDTIRGATFLAISGSEDKFTGKSVTNPATGEKIPVWEAEFVLSDYGTGAIMGVPADDERDRVFAEKHGLPIIEDYKKADFEEFGNKVTKYKLRDWVFSRQRYWGEPIPVVHCEKCGIVPVAEKDLPVELPKVKKYEPRDDGESPLASVDEWVNTTCPTCGGRARRETDVMPNWAGSSWYFLRYIDPENDTELASMDKLKHWTPVDWYNGGMEHTTLHLLYSRFWHKFLFDIGVVPTSEPYQKRTSHGLILAEGGEKMSKSRGNVVNPDEIVKTFGADTLRIYEMFMGPFEQAIAWSESSLVGPRRFLEKVWRLGGKISSENPNSSRLTHSKAVGSDATQNSDVSSLIHQTVKKVSEDIESMSFNTAISTLMIFVNTLDKQTVSKEEYETLLKLLSPFAPHITEELWSKLGHEISIHAAPWPTYDEKMLSRDEVTITVQVDSRVRATLEVFRDESEEMVKEKALKLDSVAKWLEGKRVTKTIFVKGRVLNFLTS